MHAQGHAAACLLCIHLSPFTSPYLPTPPFPPPLQYPDVATANTAKAALQGHAMYDGGHNVVRGLADQRLCCTEAHTELNRNPTWPCRVAGMLRHVLHPSPTLCCTHPAPARLPPQADARGLLQA